MAEERTNEDDLLEEDDDVTESGDQLTYLEDDFIDVEAELGKVFEGNFPRVLEVRLESLEPDEANWKQDLASGQSYDTQHGEGHTFNPEEAEEQGLVYTPPTDPPVLPSDDPQGVDIATGYAPSMEDADPDVEDLPPEVDDSDLDLLDAPRVEIALRNNSETQHLTKIKVQVSSGVVTLLGSVPGDEDIDLVYAILNDLDGVVEIRDYLSIEADEDLEAGAEGGEEFAEGWPATEGRPEGGTEAEDIVDETGDGSFPASDPPAWTSTRV
jgi:hypothetical protein